MNIKMVVYAGNIDWGQSILLLFLVTLVVIYRRFIMSATKGLFAITLNSTYGLLKSSFAMKVVSVTTKRKVPKGLPELMTFERVSPRAFRILGLNPGPHTLQGTNTWLISGSKNSTDHILVDTGEEGTSEEYIKLLFDRVFPESGTKRLSMILLTHGHGDHQGGVRRILQELQARNMLPLPTVYKRNIANGKFPCEGFACANINDLDTFQVDEDTTLQACYTPGHTDDHVGFILHEDQALLSGDCVLGCGTSVFDNLYEYMKSLQRIRKVILDSEEPHQHNHPSVDGKTIQFKGRIHTIYPGHGPVIRETALEKIDEYIAHRDAREAQILRLLGFPTQDNAVPSHHHGSCGGNICGDDQSSDGHRGVEGTRRGSATVDQHHHQQHQQQQQQQQRSTWHASWDLTGRMYGELPFIVKLSAMHNVSHHLEKLLQEGKVETRWPDLWRAKLPVR